MARLNLRKLWADSFIRSSGMMLASTFISSLLGFTFWALAARRNPVDAVGVGVTLFAVASFVSSFSLLGLNTAVIRFLPTSPRRDAMVSTVITGVCLAAGAGATLWLLGRGLVTPSLSSVSLGPLSCLAVIGILVLFSLNVAIDSPLLAHNGSEYILAKNSLVAALRIVLLSIATTSGGFALFVIASAPSTVGALGALVVLTRKFGHRLRPHLDLRFLRDTARFSGGNYLSITFKSLPAMVIPVLLTNAGEPASAAYFYVAWSVANLLYVAALWVNLSFLAEGARDVTGLTRLILRVARVNGAVLLVLMIGTLASAPLVLAMFGPGYAHHAKGLLVFLVVAALCIAVIQAITTILNLQGRIGSLTLLSLAEAGLVIGSVAGLMHRGIHAVGLAWLGGYSAAMMAYIVVMFVDRRTDIAAEEAPKLRIRPPSA